ncbi:MAG TPA: hypothetical protein VJ913_11440 [Actinomycetota bacterium]|nr:hypothetical protein [Actinomycetota bacterium]
MELRSGSQTWFFEDGRIPGLLPAAASIGAGAIHALVVPEHLEEWWLSAAFFVLSAVFQMAWGVAWIASSSPRLAGVAIVGNAAVVAVWIASRTTGIPIGPEPWMTESIGVLDLLATGLELSIVAMLAYALWATAGRRHAASV